MKFYDVIGEVDTKEKEQLINKCEIYLSEVFAELSMDWSISSFGSKLGGDPLMMQLVAAMPHFCDLTGFNYLPIKKSLSKIHKKINLCIPLSKKEENILLQSKDYKNKYHQIIDTAGTDGKRFYWAPHFVLSKSKIGVRCLILHEGMHAGLSHPMRRGHRMPSLWNISIDFKANNFAFEDLKARNVRRPEEAFKELGDFVNLEDYAAFIRDPYNPPLKMKPFSPRFQIEQMLRDDYLEIEEGEQTVLFAEPNLPKEMRQPEVIYDYLLKQVPKCKKCGNLFCYKIPEDIKEMKSKLVKIQQKNATNYKS